jgi:hypothetical protein
MKKPTKSRILKALELDEKEGLLDADSKEELYNLRHDYESACYDWADAENDYKRDEGI